MIYLILVTSQRHGCDFILIYVLTHDRFDKIESLGAEPVKQWGELCCCCSDN